MFKRFLISTLLCSTFSIIHAAPIPSEIETPEMLGINKQPWHATLMPYADLKQALTANRQQSPFACSLNGTWKFNWVPRPEERPADFFKPDFSVSGWHDLPVPSNWQIQGYGTPFYKNNGYTFKKDWPHVMSEPPKDYTAYVERNPIGSYRRDFEVPKEWQGRRIFLTFDGVDSAFFLWINGKQVGYSVNSRNPAEFDITDFIVSGKPNTLAVEVWQYSSGSYLEDQDMWRLSGIFRNVTLWSAPQVHIRDFKVLTDLDSQYKDANLAVSAKIHNYSATPAAARELTVTLYDANNQPVGNPANVPVSELAANGEITVSATIPVNNPVKWTAETPNLYTTVLKLNNGEEFISARTGFRKVEIKGRLFMINGVPVKLKGANRHENWPDTGHYVTEEHMIRDIELLKQANCNHVRTCHYTDDPRWYELCDQYGLYLVAEANVEDHGLRDVLEKQPRLEKAIVDRNIANVEEVKNHPSVVIWSLGNEANAGPNFIAALAAVKQLDLSRPVQYEPFGIGKGNPADIDSRMYTSSEGTAKITQSDDYTKPFYLCEYAHAMFNSMGGLAEYNDVFDSNPASMGGAIWEWEDQGIWNRRDPKRQYLAYGGGFGEIPNDKYFIHKGVVFSDRTPKPHFPEVKRIYQWIGFSAANDELTQGKIHIKNKYAFTNLAKFNISWNLTEDGNVISEGKLPALKLAPQQESILSLPLPAIKAKPGADYYLNIAFSLANDEPWAKKGYDIANAQFKLPVSTPATVSDSKSQPALQLSDANSDPVISGKNFRVKFDRNSGAISELSRDGENILLPGGGPKLNLWRAPHQIDDRYAFGDWERVGLNKLNAKVLSFDAVQLSPSSARITTSVQYSGENNFVATHQASYTVYGNAAISVDNAVTFDGPAIIPARIGVRLLLDKKLDQLEYFARGPMENYSDRKHGSDIGLYQSSVAAQLTPYAKPMECGNHEDTRWLAISGNKTPLLVAQAAANDKLLQFSALPYTDEELDAVPYSVDLATSRVTVLCLSAQTLGVGSASCGPRPLPQYLLHSDPAEFSYVLKLLSDHQTLTAATRELPLASAAKPVLAARNAQGEVTLSTSSGGSIAYSNDGKQWLPYTKPLVIDHSGLLWFRNSAANGESFIGALYFLPYVNRAQWKVSASSTQKGEGELTHLIDGDSSTFWHSQYSPAMAGAPHFVAIDLGASIKIKTLILTPRQDGVNGRPKDYEIYANNDGKDWGKPILKGKAENSGAAIYLTPKEPLTARHIKIVFNTTYPDNASSKFASLAEFNVIPAE
ncbi:MAG: DUF4981 domain-containing protein [Verrucomicrobiales bacterium]|jgi:beta-galactosidase|nr:DUF4981 domain-containing protein [Verrucomicrobiales bacterium]